MPQNAKAVQKERERAAFKAFALELDAANKLAEERQVRANNLKRERDAVASEVAGLRSKLADADAQTASLLTTVRQLEAEDAGGDVPLDVRRRAEGHHQLGLGEGPPVHTHAL